MQLHLRILIHIVLFLIFDGVTKFISSYLVEGAHVSGEAEPGASFGSGPIKRRLIVTWARLVTDIL